MSETTSVPSVQQQEGRDTIAQRCFHVVGLVKHHWRFVLTTVTVVVALTAVYVFSLPRSYESETTLVPEASSSSTSISGNLGALASMAVVKLGSGSSDDAIYPEFYPKVLSSTAFQSELLKDTVKVGRIGRKVCIYDYLARYQQKPWWGTLFGESKHNRKDGKNDADIDPQRPSKAQYRVMRSLKNDVFCSVDKKTDIITIRVMVQDADVAQQIADNICHRLQTYITNYRTGKARQDLEYARKVTADARKKYIAKQQEYAKFCDANEDVQLASFQQVRDRLENEMQLAYNAYSQFAQQEQQAQVKLQERTPIYTTIQPAIVPLKASAPKRMVTLAVFFVLSFFGSVVWLMVKDSLSDIKRLKA